MMCKRHGVVGCGLCQGAFLLAAIQARGDVDRDAVRERLRRIHPRAHSAGFDSCTHDYCATVREGLVCQPSP